MKENDWQKFLTIYIYISNGLWIKFLMIKPRRGPACAYGWCLATEFQMMCDDLEIDNLCCCVYGKCQKHEKIICLSHQIQTLLSLLHFYEKDCQKFPQQRYCLFRRDNKQKNTMVQCYGLKFEKMFASKSRYTQDSI